MVEGSIICGDLNGQSKLWHSAIEEDQRGAILTQQIDAASMVVLNENAPTRVPSQGRFSSPDVTIAHPNLAMSTDWILLKIKDFVEDRNPLLPVGDMLNIELALRKLLQAAARKHIQKTQAAAKSMRLAWSS